MKTKQLIAFSVRLDPDLKRRIKIRVATLGSGWTIGRLVTEALSAYLSPRKGS